MTAALLISSASLIAEGCATSGASRGPSRGPSGDSRPLYEMMGLPVVVKSGDVPRTVLLREGSAELATERSQASEDPSPEVGFHFELQHPMPQTKLAVKHLAHPENHHQHAGLSSYEKLIKQSSSLLAYWGLHRSRFSEGKILPANGPTLVNSDYEYTGISDREFGYCWGFSTFARFFTELAFYDAAATSDVPTYTPGGLGSNEKWFRFYQSRIDLILEGKAQVIPGFADFRSFSKVPEIEFYLKLKAMKLWSEHAIRVGNLSTFFSSTKPLNESQIDALLDDLQLRLSRGELTKILFTAKDSEKVLGGSVDVHAVLVTAVDRANDGSAKIHLWDIDFYAEDLNKDDKYIEVRVVPGHARETHYAPWWEKLESPAKTYTSSQLGAIRVAPENDRELKIMLNSLHDFCADSVNSRHCR